MIWATAGLPDSYRDTSNPSARFPAHFGFSVSIPVAEHQSIQNDTITKNNSEMDDKYRLKIVQAMRSIQTVKLIFSVQFPHRLSTEALLEF
jgi:hypothetical protein